MEVSSKPNKRGRPSKNPKEGPKINDCWKGVERFYNALPWSAIDGHHKEVNHKEVMRIATPSLLSFPQQFQLLQDKTASLTFAQEDQHFLLGHRSGSLEPRCRSLPRPFSLCILAQLVFRFFVLYPLRQIEFRSSSLDHYAIRMEERREHSFQPALYLVYRLSRAKG